MKITPKIRAEAIRENCAKAGKAGRGEAKARSPEKMRKAGRKGAEKRWGKKIDENPEK